MILKLFTLFFVLVFLETSYTQTITKCNNKFGLINDSGVIKLDCNYDTIFQLSNSSSFYVYKNDSISGIINVESSIKQTVVFDSIVTISQSNFICYDNKYTPVVFKYNFKTKCYELIILDYYFTEIKRLNQFSFAVKVDSLYNILYQSINGLKLINCNSKNDINWSKTKGYYSELYNDSINLFIVRDNRLINQFNVPSNTNFLFFENYILSAFNNGKNKIVEIWNVNNGDFLMV